jgi:methylglutaconyl-CoA hydratase
MSALVHVEKQTHYAIVTLSLPEKRNPLSKAMRQDIKARLEELKTDNAIRSVVITGAGSAFCSGLDLESLAEQAKLSEPEHLSDSLDIHHFFEFIAGYPLPLIAAVNGPAVAGGAGLATLCDITVASADAFLCFSEVKIGFVPALVGVYLQGMVGTKIARDLLLTARRIPAAEAKVIGLINEVVPGSDLRTRVHEVCEGLKANSPMSLSVTKSLLNKALRMNFETALELAVEVNAQARSSSDCVEGVRAFLDKRAPNWAQ